MTYIFPEYISKGSSKNFCCQHNQQQGEELKLRQADMVNFWPFLFLFLPGKQLGLHVI